MSGSTTEWTYAEYARLPDDGNHYEVIDGEVCMTPAPGLRHQRVAAKLFVALRSYVEEHRIGEVLWDVDLLFVSGQYLRPDMVFVPPASFGGLTDRGVESLPGLVVEVLSPHSRRIDLELKPPRYRDFGVPEYWVVDSTRRSIDVFRLQVSTRPETVTRVLRWQPDASVPPLALEVGPLFDDV
jgi:Uma2 family endonuclease